MNSKRLIALNLALVLLFCVLSMNAIAAVTGITFPLIAGYGGVSQDFTVTEVGDYVFLLVRSAKVSSSDIDMLRIFDSDRDIATLTSLSKLSSNDYTLEFRYDNLKQGDYTLTANANPPLWPNSASYASLELYSWQEGGPLTYGVTVVPFGNKRTFPQMPSNYNNAELAREFTIINTGSGAIDDLEIELVSPYFEMTPQRVSLNTFNRGAATTVSIRPRAGLTASALPYIGRLDVYGKDGSGAYVRAPLIDLSFTVVDNWRYGDLTGNGVVNNTDLVMLMRLLAGSSAPDIYNYSAADVNGDGIVNYADLTHFLKHFAQPGFVLGP